MNEILGLLCLVLSESGLRSRLCGVPQMHIRPVPIFISQDSILQMFPHRLVSAKGHDWAVAKEGVVRDSYVDASQQGHPPV